MGMIQRATLPEEFYDFYSAKLLIQPEPQYWHARMILNAAGVEFDAQAQLGFMAGRTFGTEGADYLASLEQDRLMLADTPAREAVMMVHDQSKRVGHTININRPAYEDTSYGQADREVPAGQIISLDGPGVQSEQIPVTLKRFVGPYNSATAAVGPYPVDRFDSNVMLHKPAQVVGKNLKRDFDKTLDSFGVNVFELFTNIQRPDGMITDNTPTATGEFPFTFDELQNAERIMDDRNIPYFSNGRRICVVSPLQSQQLKDDARWERLSEFHKDTNALYQGTYIGSVSTWDVFKSTTLLKPLNSNTVPIHHAQAFGPQSVGIGFGEMPRVANHTNDNFGETAYVIWIMYLTISMMDDRFGQSIRTA